MSKNCDCRACTSLPKSKFLALPDQDLNIIDRLKIIRKFDKKEVLIQQEQTQAPLYCIKSGRVRIEVTDASGNSVLLGYAREGDVLGMPQALLNAPSVVTAEAETEVEVCAIPPGPFLEFCKNKPELSLEFLKQMAGDVARLQERLALRERPTTSDRVIEALLYFKRHYHDFNWTRRDLAEWAGTTPETVMRVLAQLEVDGLIRKDGRAIEILQESKLQEIAKLSL